MGTIARRYFLKAASVASGSLPLVAAAKLGARGDVRIAGTAYTPIQEYPIRPKPQSDVAIADRFWKPKIDTNRLVTIPHIGTRRRALRSSSVPQIEAASHA
jgi:hypothetical protein